MELKLLSVSHFDTIVATAGRWTDSEFDMLPR